LIYSCIFFFFEYYFHVYCIVALFWLESKSLFSSLGICSLNDSSFSVSCKTTFISLLGTGNSCCSTSSHSVLSLQEEQSSASSSRVNNNISTSSISESGMYRYSLI